MLDTASFFEFKVDYSSAPNFVGAVCSMTVGVGDHTWRIYCYPRGKPNNNGEYLSVFLEKLSDGTDVKAIFEAFVLRRDGRGAALSSYYTIRSVLDYPAAASKQWGWTRLIKISDLEEHYVVDGFVRIMCLIAVLRDNDPIPVPPSSMAKDLGSLLENTTGKSDVSLVGDGETFPVHRSILAARSPVFQAQLFGHMTEGTMSTINLSQDISAPTFKALRWYIYTDTLPREDELGDSSTKLFHHLLVAADYYALDRLKLMCADKLWKNISVKTVAATLVYAERSNCPELKDRCMDFLAVEDNFKNAALTKEYGCLLLYYPAIISELRERIGAKHKQIQASPHTISNNRYTSGHVQ